MVKGLFASTLIIGLGLLASPAFSITAIFSIALVLNCFLFANLGVITGMRTKSHEDTATYSELWPKAERRGRYFFASKNYGKKNSMKRR